MNTNNIVVFDFETGGTDTKTTEPIEIAAIVLNPRTLDPIPGGRFYSLCRPTNWDIVSDEALKINGKTREQLREAPEQSVVWPAFIKFINQYNLKKNNKYTAPIPAGKNIKNFDLPIFNRLCQQYKFVDSKGEVIVFNTYDVIDLDDIIRLWFEGNDELQNKKMDTLRDYFGMDKSKAHEAMTDTVQTAQLIIRFLKYFRGLNAYEKMKNSCREMPENLASLI